MSENCVFEPQIWRPSSCRRCFGAASAHTLFPPEEKKASPPPPVRRRVVPTDAIPIAIRPAESTANAIATAISTSSNPTEIATSAATTSATTSATASPENIYRPRLVARTRSIPFRRPSQTSPSLSPDITPRTPASTRMSPRVSNISPRINVESYDVSESTTPRIHHDEIKGTPSVEEENEDEQDDQDSKEQQDSKIRYQKHQQEHVDENGIPIAPDMNEPISWKDSTENEEKQQTHENHGTVMQMMHDRNIAFLAEIRNRVPLRAVERPVLDETVVVDFSSELHWKLKKKKRTSEQRVQQLNAEGLTHLDTIAGRISRFGNITSGETATLEKAASIVKHMNDFIHEYQLNKYFLDEKENRTTEFPRVKYDTIVTLVRASETLEQRIIAAQSYVTNYHTHRNQQNADWIVLDAEMIENAMNALLNAASSMRTKIQDAANIVALDANDLLTRAGVVGNGLVDLLLAKSLQAYSGIMDASPAIKSFDLSSKAVKAYQMLSLVSKLATAAETTQLCTFTDQQQQALRDVETWRTSLQSTHQSAISVSERHGTWDRQEMVRLRSTADHRLKMTRGDSYTSNKYPVLLELLKTQEMKDEQIQELRIQLNQHTWDDEHLLQWGRMAIMNHNLSGLKLVMDTSTSTSSITSDRIIQQVVHECVLRNFISGLDYLVDEIYMDVNYRQPHGGHSPLHIAAQTSNLSLMSYLIRHHANPLLINALNRTPLSLLVIKHFGIPLFSQHSILSDTPHFLASYLDNPSLSDVTLECDTGETYHAHRIVLCSQSPVFQAMLDSQSHWKEEQENVLLPEISATGLSTLLRYLYTGQCVLHRDDAAICIEMLRLASRFMLDRLRLYVERIIAQHVDASNVISLYQLADQCGCDILLQQCRHVLLAQYVDVHDPDHTTLLHVLDSQATVIQSKQEASNAQ